METQSYNITNALQRAGEVIRERIPHVDQVSPHEVYLLDAKGKRARRICGAQRHKLPIGYVCLQIAGAGTEHPGEGACSAHDLYLINPNNTSLWNTMNRGKNLPANLMELMENAQLLEETHLSAIDEDIRMLYVLVQNTLDRNSIHVLNPDTGEQELTFSMGSHDTELVMKLLDKVIKAKQMKAQLHKELAMDSTMVKAFIDQIFKIIVTSVAPQQSRRVMEEILEKVIVPYRTKNRIKGAEFQYEPSAADMAGKAEATNIKKKRNRR